MTQKVLDKLSDKVRKSIEMWKGRYHNERLDRKVSSGEARGYIKALVDTGVISDSEFRVLFCYITV